MKKLLTASLVFLLAGCAPKLYYQVYQTKPMEDTKYVSTDAAINYSDANCTVSYNFFDKDGNAGFTITNNTDKLMRIRLDESFFVLNGRAYNYYEGRSWEQGSEQTTSFSFQRDYMSRRKASKAERRNQNIQTSVYEGSSSGGAATAATSSTTITKNSRTEQVEVLIPPHSSKTIGDYSIQTGMMHLCDVKETPGSKATGKTFSRDDTPIVFSNYITYILGAESSVRYAVSNEFYVSEIVNVSRKNMETSIHPKDACGKDLPSVKGYSMNTADRFFVTYRR